MTEEGPTEKTLEDGTKVMEHSDGTQVMLPHNSLSAALDGLQEAQGVANAAQTAQRLAAVEAKRAAQASGDSVPSDKSPL